MRVTKIVPVDTPLSEFPELQKQGVLSRLANAGVLTVRQLAETRPSDLLRNRHLGQGTVCKCQKFLSKRGLSFRDELEGRLFDKNVGKRHKKTKLTLVAVFFLRMPARRATKL